jgi:hypothetical protein
MILVLQHISHTAPDPAKVSEVFNDFFINVAKNIGNTNVIVNKEHPSVCMIKENKLITDDLNFKRKNDTSIHLLIKNVIGSTIHA